MTEQIKSQTPDEGRSLFLPFDPTQIMRARVLPAQFARMVGASKQSVSRWIASGKLVIGVDGKIDPAEGMRQLARNCDPGRFRTRLIRQALADMRTTMEQAARAAVLEDELADARRLIERYGRALALAAERIADEAGAISRLPTLDGRRRKASAILRRSCSAAGIEPVPDCQLAAPEDQVGGPGQ